MGGGGECRGGGVASAGGFQELVDGEGSVLYSYGVVLGVHHYAEGLTDGVV